MTETKTLRHRAVRAAVMGLGISIWSASALSGQTPTTDRDRVYFEVAGNGLAYSVNFERTLWRGLDVRVGAGGLPIEDWRYALGFAMVGWQMTHGSHAVRGALGAGIIRFEDVFFLEGGPQTSVYGTAALAYRFQPRRRGLFFQLAFTPVLEDATLWPWPGLALGYAY